MFNGKNKAVTFSYDDGVMQDIRLIKIFNKYGLKATFNLNSELFSKAFDLTFPGDVKVHHNSVDKNDVRKIYEGHEIAVHTLTHPDLTKTDEKEIIRQVVEDQKNLSELAGYEVQGMAYPGGVPNYNSRVAQIIEDNTNIKYARTTICSYDFAPQRDLIEFHPTIHHNEWDRLFSLAEKFLNSESNDPQIFYIWGHSYEFDADNSWDKMDEFCKLISGHNDVFYGTNIEVL